jgi:ERCC4-type nuclease
MGFQVVRIDVDVHEPAAVVDELRRLGTEVRVAPLPVADYRSGSALVERKTVRDLHLTLAAGRLWGRLGRLRAAGSRPFLLVEGASLDAAGIAWRAARRSSSRDRPVYAQRPKPSTAEGVLAAVPGISTMSARALLGRFGSLQAIVNASDADLMEVQGIGPLRARNLRAAVTHQHVSYRSRRSRERPGRAT